MTSLLVLSGAAISAIMGLSAKQEAINTISTSDESNTAQQVFVETEETPIGTKCYVDSNSVEAVAKLGWEIEEDNEGFFYKTTKGRQKIVNVTTFNSDLDELRKYIVTVENTSISIQALTGNFELIFMNNATLGYIRSFNAKYVDGSNKQTLAWMATAGTVDPRLNKIIDHINGCDNYFSNFVSNAEYSSVYHYVKGNPHRNERENNYEFSLFKDPVTGRHEIDLIHMFASMDGCYDYTYLDLQKLQYIPGVNPNFVHDLASWGGDLQQVINKTQNLINKNELTYEEVNYSPFEYFMNNNFGCPESDLIADMDAVNVTDLYLTGPGRTSDALRDYYGLIHSDTERSSRFVDAVLNDQNQNWTGTKKERFKKEVYDIVGLSLSGNKCVESNDYLSTNTISKTKFAIMRDGNINPETSVRKAIADKFCNYIFSLC